MALPPGKRGPGPCGLGWEMTGLGPPGMGGGPGGARCCGWVWGAGPAPPISRVPTEPPISRLQFSQEHLREPWRSGHPALALPQRPSRRGTALLRGCLPVSPSPARGPAPPHHMVPHLWGVRCPPTSSAGAQTLAQPSHSVPWRSSLRPRGVEAVGQLPRPRSGARGSGVTRAVPLGQEGARGGHGPIRPLLMGQSVPQDLMSVCLLAAHCESDRVPDRQGVDGRQSAGSTRAPVRGHKGAEDSAGSPGSVA